METWMALTDWLRELDATFAFLLALPFVVGTLGLLALRESTERREPNRAEQRTHGAAGAHAR